MWIMQIMNIENLTNIEIPVYLKFTNIQIRKPETKETITYFSSRSDKCPSWEFWV
jgi:hypothetical protein